MSVSEVALCIHNNPGPESILLSWKGDVRKEGLGREFRELHTTAQKHWQCTGSSPRAFLHICPPNSLLTSSSFTSCFLPPLLPTLFVVNLSPCHPALQWLGGSSSGSSTHHGYSTFPLSLPVVWHYVVTCAPLKVQVNLDGCLVSSFCLQVSLSVCLDLSLLSPHYEIAFHSQPSPQQISCIIPVVWHDLLVTHPDQATKGTFLPLYPNTLTLQNLSSCGLFLIFAQALSYTPSINHKW